MDIARSIDFDSLDKSVHRLPPVPPKDHGIDVNRRFDLYTTTTNDAPPVYQKDQPQDGVLSIISSRSNTLESLKPPSTPKYILKTISRPPSQPWDIETDYARRSGQISRSSQHPEIVPVPKPHDPLSSVRLGHESAGPQQAEETTIHCEMTGATMDYTQPDEGMPGKMGLVKGASTCCIRVTSRRKRLKGNDFRTVRSIWVIADDGKTCIQQKLPHDAQIIPYTLWSSEQKVIIHHPTTLRYYASPTSTHITRTTKTSWVTYAFPSLSSSTAFQSALLFPLHLIKSLPTRRTMRLHPSPFIRAFSPSLQLCGLENLRIFKDATDPGCLVCLIHYSPNFQPSDGAEYIVFRIYPPPRNTVRIREDGGKRVKIKGLDIRGTAASELQKQKRRKEGGKESRVERAEEEAYGSESVEKILIQFEAEEGKRVFLGLTRELQGLSSW